MGPYEKYLSGLASEKEKMVDTLIRWVDINSGTTNLPGLSAMAAELKTAFSSLQPLIKEVDLKPCTSINERGLKVEQPLGKALVMTKRSHAPIQVFLGGHMDTVFPANSPFQKAERMDKHVLKGPGATDMKGGLLILLKSLEILESSPFAKNIGWQVVINPDEEIGSPGSAPLLTEIAKHCHFGLIFEPALSSGALVNARKGSFNFAIVAKGKSAHAGRDFHLGSNAISALSKCIVQIDALTNLDRGITINVGKITGGGPLNIVPDLAVCWGNARMIEPEDLPKLKEDIQTIVDKFSLHLHFTCERPPKPFDVKHQALFEAFHTCGEFQTHPSGGVTDGNLLNAAGLPSLDSLGALGGEIHTHDEFLLIDSLVKKTEHVSLFLMKVGNGELPYNFRGVNGS